MSIKEVVKPLTLVCATYALISLGVMGLRNCHTTHTAHLRYQNGYAKPDLHQFGELTVAEIENHLSTRGYTSQKSITLAGLLSQPLEIDKGYSIVYREHTFSTESLVIGFLMKEKLVLESAAPKPLNRELVFYTQPVKKPKKKDTATFGGLISDIQEVFR